MGGKETVELIVRNYAEKVKPLLDRGEYFFAKMELGNLNDVARLETREILSTVHMGGNFITVLRELEQACQESSPRPDYIDSIRAEFEVYAAQTRLPKGPTD